MRTKKISGFILVSLGIVIFVAGSYQYNKSRTPNACMVSFAKSLGGKASLELDNAAQRGRRYGIASISVGILFTLAGSFLLLNTRRRRF